MRNGRFSVQTLADRRKHWACTLFLSSVSLITGCTRFSETYHVGVVRKGSSQPLQFYRFRLEGQADWGSKTMFLSGWYPAQAIQAVVGEHRQGDLPFVQPWAKFHEFPRDANTFTMEPLRVEFDGSQNITSTLQNPDFNLSRKLHITLAQLRRFKWRYLMLSARPLGNSGFFQITIPQQQAQLCCEQTTLSDILMCGRKAVEFSGQSNDQTLVVRGGMKSIAASGVFIDARLQKTAHWEATDPGVWTGSRIEKFEGENGTSQWTIYGSTETEAIVIPELAEAGHGWDRLLAKTREIRVQKPRSLEMRRGWRFETKGASISLPKTQPDESPTIVALFSGSCRFQISVAELHKWLDHKYKDAIDKGGAFEFAIGDDMERPLVHDGTQDRLESAPPASQPTSSAVPSEANVQLEGDLACESGRILGLIRVISPSSLLPNSPKLWFSQTRRDEPTRTPAGLEYWVVGPEGSRRSLSNQRLVVFMASNPEPVTQAIQGFAQSQEVQDSMVTILRHLRSTQKEKGPSPAKKLILAGLRRLREQVRQQTTPDTDSFVQETLNPLVTLWITNVGNTE